VLEHLAKIAAVDPTIASRTSDEMLGFARLPLADRSSKINSPGDHRRGGSWMSSGHTCSTTMRISSEIIWIAFIDELDMQSPQAIGRHGLAIDSVALDRRFHWPQSYSAPGSRPGPGFHLIQSKYVIRKKEPRSARAPVHGSLPRAPLSPGYIRNAF
jgi:hypothetical protein